MAYASTDIIGVGMYSVAEAAMYANVPASAMRRWLWGTTRDRSVVKPQLRRDEDDRYVTFLDFIQTLTIRSLRIGRDDRPPIPLDKIRETIELAEREHNITYPFARRHTVYSLGREIILDVDGVGKLQTSGNQKRQFVEEKIVELHLRDIGYSAIDGLAENFTSARDGGMEIRMSPRMRFGEPYLVGRGITAYSIWNAVQAEGSVEGAARAYEITDDEAAFAARYYESVRAATAH
jgi:uncharacterized protein (DUF433 family)